MISQLVRPPIRNMTEINWGDISDTTGLRLLWGENQSCPDIYRPALEQEIAKVNLYPSPTKQALKEALAQYNQLRPENIIPTNGSDEALELIAKVFINDGDEVLMPLPTYPCFASVSQMMGARITTIPLTSDFSLNVGQLLQAVTPQTKIIWLANPNNPTGNVLVSQNQIANLAKKTNCLLVVDECYVELSGVSGASLVKQYPNLLIVRSFSKIFALAGARLGYIICNPAVATYLNRLQQTNQVFGVNRFAQAAALAILCRPEVISQTITEFRTLKDTFVAKLRQIPELDIKETQTTFCLAKIVTPLSAQQLKTELAQQQIFIKDCSIYEGLGGQYIYLGVPLATYQDQVVTSISQILRRTS